MVQIRQAFVAGFAVSPFRRNLFVGIRPFEGSLSDPGLLGAVIGRTALGRFKEAGARSSRQQVASASQEVLIARSSPGSSPGSSWRTRKKSHKQSQNEEQASNKQKSAEEQSLFRAGVGIVFVEMDLIAPVMAEVTKQFPHLLPRHFHSGVGGADGDKQETAEKVLLDIADGTTRCIVTSNALLLGVNIPDVRVVVVLMKIHGDSDIVQAFGRAGRDGKLAYCQVWYKDRKDPSKQASMFAHFWSDLQNAACVNQFLSFYF